MPPCCARRAGPARSAHPVRGHHGHHGATAAFMATGGRPGRPRMLAELSGRTTACSPPLPCRRASSAGPRCRSRMSRLPNCPRTDRRLCGHGRAPGQGGRLWHPGPGAAALITHLSGSYSGIMGLPLFETAQTAARRRFCPLTTFHAHHAPRHSHQLVAPGNPCGRGRAWRRARAAHRTHA